MKKYSYAFFGFPAIGHTGPSLGLVKKLMEEGHEVTYFSRVDQRDIIQKTGAIFVDYDSQSLINTCIPGTEIDSLKIQDFHIGLHKILLICASEILDKIYNISHNFNGVIYDQFAIWGQIFADMNNLPSFCSCPMFLDSTENILPRLPGINELEVDYIEKINLLKKYTLSIESHKDILDYLTCKKANWVITYTSKYLQPNSSTLFSDEKYIYLGNRFDKKYPPNNKKLENNSIIYVSLGTIFNGNLKVLTDIIDFFSSYQYNVQVSSGGNDYIFYKLQSIKKNNNITIYKFVNQLEMLEKCSLFITHAGLNSLYESLYYTVPMIMIPQMAEHNINARRLKELNAAYLIESPNELKANLTIALDNIVSNWQLYKNSCSKIRESFINSEDNVSVAKKISNITLSFKLNN